MNAVDVCGLRVVPGGRVARKAGVLGGAALLAFGVVKLRGRTP